MLVIIYIALWIVGLYHLVACLGFGAIGRFLIFSRFGLFRFVMRPKETTSGAANLLRKVLRHGVITAFCAIGIILFHV